MSIDTLSNRTYDILKEARNIKTQEPIKPFDPLKIYAKQSKLKKSSSAIDHASCALKELYSKSKDLAEEHCKSDIKKLKEEKIKIDKELEQKAPGSEIKDNEKQKLEERKNSIDTEIEALKKDKAEKIFGHLLALYKTFDTIQEASRLADKQFKQALMVAGTEWAYNATSKVGQSFQEVIKTLFKLILENKL